MSDGFLTGDLANHWHFESEQQADELQESVETYSDLHLFRGILVGLGLAIPLWGIIGLTVYYITANV